MIRPYPGLARSPHRTGKRAAKHFLYEDIPASSGWHNVFGSVAFVRLSLPGSHGHPHGAELCADARRRV